MKTRLSLLVIAVVAATSVGLHSQQQPSAPASALPSPPVREPGWAFPIQAGSLPPESPEPKSVEGSTKKYTPKEIDDLLNPPDWLPEAHKPAPSIVVKGHGAALACGSCHLMSGLGHPESADLTGYTADIHRPADAGLQDRRAQGLRAHERHLQGGVGRGSAAGCGLVCVVAAAEVCESRRSGDGAEDVRRSGTYALRRSEADRDGADR